MEFPNEKSSVKKQVNIAYIDATNNVQHKTTDIVGVCHPSWRGIKSATYALTPVVFEVAEISSFFEAERIADEIMKDKPQKVILNGYPNGYDILAEALKTKFPETRVFFLSHTSFTWYNGRPDEVSWLEKMFKAYERGFIEKMGFIKPDVAVYFKEKGISTFHVMNRIPKFESFKHNLNLNMPNLGVWGSNMWHRNLLNQTIAGLMLNRATVHVNELPKYFFLDESRIKRYNILPHEEYAKIMQSMDINLYVSFTDCFPVTVVESLCYGIPCLTSDTSLVYTWSEYLKNNLIISKIDSPIAIRDKVKFVFDNYDKIQTEISNYLPLLEERIEKTIAEFIA
ncbi:MAG: hypothetical protein WCP09_02420 [Candidatus Taylorbacteria bacterium]